MVVMMMALNLFGIIDLDLNVEFLVLNFVEGKWHLIFSFEFLILNYCLFLKFLRLTCNVHSCTDKVFNYFFRFF